MFSFLNPWVLLGGLVVLIAAFGGGYMTGKDMIEGQVAREERAALIARNEALKVTAAAIATIEVKNTTIKQKVEREVREKTIYRECKHTPDGLRGINSALGHESAGDSKLPKANPAK
jgi:hypothetical protein